MAAEVLSLPFIFADRAMLKQTIGFVGAGQMARALARGWVQAKLVEGQQILAHDPSKAAIEQFTAEVGGARVVNSNAAVIATADVVILAVKPQNVPELLEELRSVVSEDKLIVSIAAGVSLATLSAGLKTTRLVRVMPNTPCIIGQGASGYALGPGASKADGRLVGQLLEAVGIAFAIPERLLDAVTGLSGSGPAYVFTVIEALSDGGVRVGLPRETATALAVQTVLGSAAMIKSTGEHPAVLKDRVASPGGTTMAGLSALEGEGLRGALIAAVEAATDRSIELGRQQQGASGDGREEIGVMIDDKHVPLYRVVWVSHNPHFCGDDECMCEGQYEIRLEQDESVWANREERDGLLSALKQWIRGQGLDVNT